MSNDKDVNVNVWSHKKVVEEKKENIVFYSGINGENRSQIIPKLQTTSAEKFFSGLSNTVIVLGNDRPAGIASGNGGIGMTGAGCIDIVAGLMGERPIESIAGKKFLCQKDFKNDKARIYISEMCDLDSYFGIPKISTKLTQKDEIKLEATENTSGIGIKSDHIRIIGRENIKLVTNHSGINSKSKKGPHDGVYLIAGYDMMPYDKKYELEPMVRGNKLAAFLENLLNNLQNVQSNISAFMNFQIDVNLALMNHVHISGAPGHPSHKILGQDILEKNVEMMRKTVPDAIYNTIKNELVKQYLQSSSPGYINSLWHKLN